MFLNRHERAEVDACAERIERDCGVRIVTHIVGKADNYPELPWKAFALGCTLAAFISIGIDAAWPSWTAGNAALLHGVAVLAPGLAGAALAILYPPFGRLFLRRPRASAEVRQYARSFFMRRALFETPARRGVLVLVSLFERKVQILPDVGLERVITRQQWDRVIARMRPLLRERKGGAAMQSGLADIEALLREQARGNDLSHAAADADPAQREDSGAAPDSPTAATGTTAGAASGTTPPPTKDRRR